MPAIIAKSIAILSDAGLGMAMFSLGMLNVASMIFIHVFSKCSERDEVGFEIQKCKMQGCSWHCSLGSLLVENPSLGFPWVSGSWSVLLLWRLLLLPLGLEVFCCTLLLFR